MPRIWLGLLATLAVVAGPALENEIAQWRRARASALQAEGGWLTVAGLFWLHEGANSFGCDPASEIVLADGPAQAGVFELRAGSVTVTMKGESARRELQPDSSDLVKAGRLSLFLIKRGDRLGIRLKDPENPARKAFHGLDYFPASEAYRVTARWVVSPRQIPVLNVLGQTEPSLCPGYAEFRIGVKELRLYPILEAPDAQELFYIFRDQTSGRETYPAGRFLYSALPKDGRVVLDFNKAVNPPCAFTAYATCPLPPPENRLPVRIEAGEKKYH
ncbi:MAG: DUF1684 domain-containing protein [Bryobacteraceae bacterium]|jgi:uncharacterized protein (DUF1684 family)